MYEHIIDEYVNMNILETLPKIAINRNFNIYVNTSTTERAITF